MLRRHRADPAAWHLLATLTRRPTPPDPAQAGTVAELTGLGWVHADDGRVSITPAGTVAREQLAARVEVVDDQVAAALTAAEQAVLLDLLTRLADGLELR